MTDEQFEQRMAVTDARIAALAERQEAFQTQLEFLYRSTESLHATVHEMVAAIQHQQHRIEDIEGQL